jgi:aspartate racemase
MRTIGLLGGMSWESTLVYYRLINQGVRARLGGLRSAPIMLNSLDFGEVEPLQASGDWPALMQMLVGAARRVEQAGAECLLVATNTMHKVADEIESAIGIPLIHVVDVTAAALERDGIERVGLLGTRFTMEDGFWRERLERRFGIETIVPGPEQMATINQVIFEELCHGVIRDHSRRRYLQIIASLNQRGARAVILGCTEIGMLVGPDDIPVPLYDTTELHAAAAVEFALQEAVQKAIA